MQACQGLQSWCSQVQEQKWDGSVVMGWRQAGVKGLADFHSLRVWSVSDRLWNLAVQDPVSQAKHPRGTHAFWVLLHCLRAVWVNHFIPAKIKGKVDWVKKALEVTWCHQGHAVCDSDFCMICISDAVRLHIPGPSGALFVWGYRTGSDFSGHPPAKNL